MFIYPWGDFHSLNLGWFLLQFTDWVEKIQEYLDNGGGTSENLANVIAPVFNAANSYQTGDYVLYNNELYKANQAVNPGTWDPDAWTNCLIVDEMGTGGGSAGVDNVARLMIAGQYSASFAYQKYGICRYNDKLWMANTDLPAGGEAWNPAHWDEITVGAGLTGLRRSVETLNTNIENIQGSLNTLQEDATLVNPKIKKWDVTQNGKILFVGNSYNVVGSPNLPTLIGNILGLISGEDYFSIAQNGHSFVNTDVSYTFINDLTTWVTAQTTEIKESIGAVLIIGGLNDCRDDRIASVGTAMNDVASYIKTNLPNSCVYIGFTAIFDPTNASVPSDITVSAFKSIYREYLNSVRLGWQYLNGIESILYDKNYIDTDGIHPNQAGVNLLGRFIIQAILAGNTKVYREYSNTITGSNVVTGSISSVLSDNMLTLKTSISNIALDRAVSLSAGWTDLGVLNLPCNILTYGELGSIPVSVWDSNNQTAVIMIRLQFDYLNKKLRFVTLATLTNPNNITNYVRMGAMIGTLTAPLIGS